MPTLNSSKLSKIQEGRTIFLSYEELLNDCGNYYQRVTDGYEENKFFNKKITLNLNLDIVSDETKIRKLINFDEIEDVFFRESGSNTLTNIPTEEYMITDENELKILSNEHDVYFLFAPWTFVVPPISS